MSRGRVDTVSLLKNSCAQWHDGSLVPLPCASVPTAVLPTETTGTLTTTGYTSSGTLIRPLVAFVRSGNERRMMSTFSLVATHPSPSVPGTWRTLVLATRQRGSRQQAPCVAAGDPPRHRCRHHVAGTYDGSVLKVYVDGGLVESVECSGTPYTGMWPGPCGQPS